MNQHSWYSAQIFGAIGEARRKTVIEIGVWRRPLAIWTDWTDFSEGNDARPTKRRPEPEVLAIFAKHLSNLPEFFLVR